MKFSNEQVIPASIETVERMYWDPEFCLRKYQLLGLQDIQRTVSHKDAQRFEVSCNFKMKPSIEVPKLAQKFVGVSERLAVTQRDIWDMPKRSGRLEINIHSLKTVTIGCDMKLETHPQGTVNRMQWTVECSVPLIGETLAKFLAQDIQRKFADDLAATVKVLEQHYR